MSGPRTRIALNTVKYCRVSAFIYTEREVLDISKEQNVIKFDWRGFWRRCEVCGGRSDIVLLMRPWASAYNPTDCLHVCVFCLQRIKERHYTTRASIRDAMLDRIKYYKHLPTINVSIFVENHNAPFIGGAKRGGWITRTSILGRKIWSV